MPVPDLTDRRHPYVQIADDLQGKITAGRYRPGDKLPSNAQMREEYGSSKQTITNAVRELEGRGLVATHSTRGAFVLRSSAKPEPGPEASRVESALQAVEARLTRHLEDELARLRADEIAPLREELRGQREELEYVQAQVMAVGDGAGGASARGRGVG
jgi:DNA-binding GntR family transcriptional regulator